MSKTFQVSYDTDSELEAIFAAIYRYVDWSDVCKRVSLPEHLILKYVNFFNFDELSMFQQLSESFIETYSDRVCWWAISRFQLLSEDFIRRHADRVDWGWIVHHQNCSAEFITEMQLKGYISN